MSRRQDILNAIRSKNVPAAELPSLNSAWTRYEDPRARFAQTLRSVGGECIVVPNLLAIGVELSKQPQVQSASLIYSGLDAGIDSNVDIAAIDDPHDLEDIELAILPGEFAVAENGAVWVTDKSLQHRVTYFIAQHLVLVVAADQILHNMHEAYERLSFTQPGFGVFISGPSKTADIEQSLVIGAHGPRSLIVCLVES